MGIKQRIDAAQGRIPCDLILSGVKYFDVFSAEFREGEIAISDGTIVGLESGLKAKRTISCQRKTVVPGFIDAHVHVESSLMLPQRFDQAVLPTGTTTAICDPHEITNVIGVEGLKYFLKAAPQLQMDLWVMLSSCVPATHLETNGGGSVEAKDLIPLQSEERALGLAEVMNMPGVLNNDPSVLEKLEAFQGSRIDGHSPLLRGKALSAYLAAGISSCHESSQLGEAAEKLSKGMAVWIREGSVAKDLDELSPLLTLATSPFIGFCTDDRNPYDIAEQGHIDHLVRSAIRNGVKPEAAFRAASISVARHYGLDRGKRRVGAVAPGWAADLILLDDVQSVEIHRVLKNGEFTQELDYSAPSPSSDSASHSVACSPLSSFENTIRCELPEVSSLVGPKGSVHIIEVEEGKILTGRSVGAHDAQGVSHLTVVERYGNRLPPSNAYVRGFGNLKGAIASSVGHDSHNLIAVGGDPASMRTALGVLIEQGGGFAVAQKDSVLASLALPFGGLMSARSPGELKGDIEKLKAASRSIGCALEEPFLQLAFLSLPVIPSLKLTDRGLVDVDRFEFISVQVS